MIYKSKKSQSILDFVLVFGILLVFLVGLTRIWVWFNANYAKRNVDYQNSRREAGGVVDGSPGTYRDKTLALNDDWIFEGIPSGTVRLPPDAKDIPGGPDDPVPDVCSNARESADNLRAQAHCLNCRANSLDFDCDGDDKSCKKAEKKAKKLLRDQALALKEKADSIEMEGCGSIQPYQEPVECPVECIEVY